MKVLIVDDEIMLVRSMRRFLELRGVEVFTAFSGEEALEQLDTHSIDVVITDVVMAPMNGHTLVKKIREQNDDIVIIIMTGILNISGTINELENGADGYLIKPFSNLNYVWEVLLPWVNKFGLDTHPDATHGAS